MVEPFDPERSDASASDILHVDRPWALSERLIEPCCAIDLVVFDVPPLGTELWEAVLSSWREPYELLPRLAWVCVLRPWKMIGR